MTDINYTYVVTDVNTFNKAMTIRYTSDLYGSVTVGAPTPYDDQTLDQVAEAYAPIGHWLESTKNRLAVSPGQAGSSTYSHPVQDTTVIQMTKPDLAHNMRQVPHGDTNLWEAFKAELLNADTYTQEDWDMTYVVNKGSSLFTAVITTLKGDEAQATIDALFQ